MHEGRQIATRLVKDVNSGRNMEVKGRSNKAKNQETFPKHKKGRL